MKDNFDLTFTIDEGDMQLIETLDRGGSVTWEYGDPLAVKQIYKILKYFNTLRAKTTISKKAMNAEIICTTVMSGGKSTNA